MSIVDFIAVAWSFSFAVNSSFWKMEMRISQ